MKSFEKIKLPRKKPFVSKTNQLKRMQFAGEYLKKDDNYWNDVLFRDESK